MSVNDKQELNVKISNYSQLSHSLNNLLNSNEYSDIVLNVSGKKYYAHKAILVSRSKYFRSLLSGNSVKSQKDEIEIDVDKDVFDYLLKYIYTGEINLSTDKKDILLRLSIIANKYGLDELEIAVCDLVKKVLCLSNICTIYELAIKYHLLKLISICDIFMNSNASQILDHTSFFSLTPSTLEEMIKSDSFFAKEIQIFCSVQKWYTENANVSTEAFNSILKYIRLPLIDVLDMVNIVMPSKLITDSEILGGIAKQSKLGVTYLQNRGRKVPDENVAIAKLGSIVLIGNDPSKMLNGIKIDNDLSSTAASFGLNTTAGPFGQSTTAGSFGHNTRGGIFGDSTTAGSFGHNTTADSTSQELNNKIVVQLGHQCIVNHIRMLLQDRDNSFYCYQIEVSLDQKDWVKIVDYSKYYCRSWQYIYFSPMAIRFIKVNNIHTTKAKPFSIVALEAYYTTEERIMHKDFICLKSNGNLTPNGIKLIAGIPRSPEYLLFEKIYDYGSKSGYIYHTFGSSVICIALGQPYWLSSCRLMLWDCDNESYGYCIEVSANKSHWEVIADRTTGYYRSWQIIEFKERAVAFFRIKGVKNSSGNKEFRLVHFECPNQMKKCRYDFSVSETPISEVSFDFGEILQDVEVVEGN